MLFTWRNALGGGVLAFALWGVIAAGWMALGGSGADATPAEPPGVAVLPLEYRSPVESDAYFTDGLHDELLTQLSKVHAEATALDPDFAVAYAKEASAHARMYFQGHDVTPSRLAKAKAAMDRALALDPDHPEVRQGYGDYLYYALREYEAALTEYRAALQKLPNSASLLARIAWIQRRQGH